MIKYLLQCLFVVFLITKTTAQTTYTVQPDATTGIDAWVLSEYTPNNDTSTNYGTDARLDAWRWTNTGVPYSARAYLKFDVSSLPTTAVVCSAILTVHTDANNEMSGSNQPNAFYLKRATSSWTQSGITWHNQPTLSTTNVISVGSYTSTTAGTSYTIDVSSHIQDMINNPSTNYGWGIMLQNETNTYAALGLASSNHATAAYRPMLTVVYVPSLTVTPTSATLCAGGSTTLTVSGASTYSWTPPSSGLSASTGTSVVATPTANITYTVTGTTGSCATAVKTIAVTVNPLPTLSVAPSATPSICNGSSVTFTASGASTYTWTPNTSLTCSVCASPVANPTANTNYTVTGTNSNGCVNTKAVTLTVNPLPTLTVSPSSPTICKGSSITFTASGASTYTWTPNTSLTCSVCPSPAANPTATTNYTVTGTNSNGCVNTKAVTLTVNPVPSVTVNSPDTIYGSQTATLTATGATTYSWTPATGLSATTGSTVIASPTVTTIYTVTGTGANTCTASATANVVNLNVYFRSTQTGNWSSNSTWQSSLDNSMWTSATSTPTYKSRAVTIQTGHKVTIASSVTIDETTVNGALIYGNNVGNNLTINDGTGTDLTVNGSFQHNSPDSVIWLASSTWSLGSNDTLLINTNTTGKGWRTNYAGGISTIPATAYWILNKTSSVNPSLYSNTGMYYPNLIIQNNTGTIWTTTTPSSFTGSAAPPIIKGNLSIGGSGTGNVSFLDTNNNVTSILVNGNLTINSGSVLRSHGTGFEVQGNFILNGTIDYGTANPTFVLSGSNNQTITGSSLSFKNLSLNKSSFAATVTLNSAATVTGAFTFIKGVLITDTVHLLTFNAGSTVSGTNNDSSFVSGPVKKIGNTAFTFPLGKHSNAQTIGITAPSNTTDAFQAEYFDTNPTTLYGNLMDTTFDYVNTCQYFNLYRKNGTSNIQPTLSYDLSSCVLQMYPSPRVVLFNGTKWTDKGEANFTYGSFGGTISTASVVSSYGHIALGNYSLGSSPIDTIFINLNPTSPPDFANEPPNNAYSYYANQGQVTYFGTNHTLADSVKFVSELTSPKFYFADKKVSTVYFNEYPLNDSTVIDTIQRIDMNFYHCNADAKILGTNPSGSSFNYAWGFINSGQGVNGVVGNERLYITNVYKNIDFHVFSNQKGVKYYFVVRPGGNPANINLQFTGAKSLALAGDSLTINSFNSRMTFQQPIAYYATDSLHVVQNPGTISWANTGTNIYGVSISSYMNTKPLIIELTQGANGTLATNNPYWSTLIPGISDDVGRTIDYDHVNDYVFVGGETNSNSGSGHFPVSASTGGFQQSKGLLRDGYILTFDPSRQLYWGTFIGGDQNDYVHKIKFSSAEGGKLYLAGSTFSENQTTTTGSKFPTKAKTGAFNQLTGGGSQDPSFGSGYITRLNVYGTTPSNRGNQEWTSFFGSPYSAITGLDVNSTTQDVYICGTLFNTPASTLSCTPTGGMVLCKPYSTSYLAGWSGMTSGIGAEGFIAKFDSACVLGWSTMIGTPADDYFYALAVDPAHHSLSVVGETFSAIRKVGTGYTDTTINSSTSYGDAWFIKFNTNDYSRKWQTLYGGTEEDSPRGVAIDSKGNTFVTGVMITHSNTTPTACDSGATQIDFPLCYSGSKFGEQVPSGGGPKAANNFIAEFDTTNNLVWSSVIGSNGEYSEATEHFFWSGSPSVCVDKVTDAVLVCGTTYGSQTIFCQSSSGYDYNQSINSQYSPSATNAYITEFDGSTSALNWGTLFGGEGSRTINNATTIGPSTIVEGDAGTDIVSYNGNVFITGTSYSGFSYPTSVPPNNGVAYSQQHSNGVNQDIIVAEFTSPSGQNGIKSIMAKKENEYMIYPNPNNGNFTIQGNIPANSQIQIMNGIGQLVYSAKQEHTLSETTINLANLQQGIYILSIIKESGISSQKIIIFN